MGGRERDGMEGILYSPVWVVRREGNERDFHLTLFGMRGEGRENFLFGQF